jgi:phosphoribosylformylglycinamidine synthase
MMEESVIKALKLTKDPDLLPRAPTISDWVATELQKILKESRLDIDEYKTLREKLGRSPSKTELGMVSAMWSEHCSYKSSRVHLGRLLTKGEQVIVGPGENAGIVRLHDKLGLAFKMESHNHPSYIEPFQGAATGVGGILRDVFCMGARPIANVNCLRFGEKSHKRTPYLYTNVVRGIGGYGNCIGIPTVQGNISFNKRYNHNCLVNAMSVGLIREDKIFKGFASGVGNLVVYVGSATGRDGIHGATMASDSFASAETESKTTVQVGDPFAEKLLLEATLEVLDKGLVIGLQDMGAAGLTSSSIEMASRAETGLIMNLDLVPMRAKMMTAYELMLSESQERMLMVVTPENLPALNEVLDKWQLAHAVVGMVSNTGRIQIVYKNILEADMPVNFLADNAPKYERPMRPRTITEHNTAQKILKKLNDVDTEKLLGELLSQHGFIHDIYNQYDHHIGLRTILGPEEGGAAVLWVKEFQQCELTPHLGVAISSNCNEYYCRVDAHVGAAYAVLSCAREISAVGGQPLAITDCMNFGNPEEPEVMGDFADAVNGINEACAKLNTPVVSGNVSLYNETDNQSIDPTPMIGMVGKVTDVRHVPKAIFTEETIVYALIPKVQSWVLNGALSGEVLGVEAKADKFAPINWDAEIEAMNWIRQEISQEKFAVARQVGRGGLLLTLAKMTLPHELGCKISTDELMKANSDAKSGGNSRGLWYFAELPGMYVLGLKSTKGKTQELNQSALRHNLLIPLGKIIKGGSFEVDGHKFSSKNLAALHGAKPVQ